MDKELASRLSRLVADKEMVDVLVEYMEHRINWLHRNNESAPDKDTITRNLGAVRELRRLETLREEIELVRKEQ